MAIVIESSFDPEFSGRRAALLAALRPQVSGADPAWKAAGDWLDKTYAEAGAQAAWEARLRTTRAKDNGQMTPPSGLPRRGPGPEPQLLGDHLWADRLEQAIADLDARNAAGDPLRILGDHQPRPTGRPPRPAPPSSPRA